MKILFEEELNEVKESNQPRDIFQSFVYLYNQNQEVDIEAIALMSSFEKEKVLKALDCFVCQDPLVFDSCHDCTVLSTEMVGNICHRCPFRP